MNLVTGATGIVGLRLVYDLVRKGEPTRALRRTNSDMAFAESTLKFYGLSDEETASIDWIIGDLNDIFSLESALKEIDTVYHAAALVSYRGKDSDRLFKVNAEGTANLVNTALSSGIKRFCQISSVAALGTEKEGLIDENTQWKRNLNRSLYGMSKFLAEQEVWRGEAEGMNVAVVNPSIILGPSKPDQSSGMLMDILAKGSKFHPSGGVGVVDVRDVSEFCIKIMESESFGEKYLLNSENLSYRELLDIAARVFENDPPSLTINKTILEVTWRVAAGIRFLGLGEPRITKETARNAVGTNAYDNRKALELLGKPFIKAEESLEFLKSFIEFRA